MGVLKKPFDEFLLHEMIKEEDEELFSNNMNENEDIMDSLMENNSFAEDLDTIFPKEDFILEQEQKEDILK